MACRMQPVRDVQRMALFQVNFRYQNIQATPLAFTGLAAEPLDVDNGFAKFDLACEMTADANRLRGYIEYSADLFDRRTAQRIAGDFQTLLVEVVTNPDLALQALHSQREESLLTH